MTRLAYVVSSHGFGHAARSCAVIAALWEHDPTLRVEIFAGTPPWFFHQSLESGAPSNRSYAVHEASTDVGLRQTSALREDVDATRRALDDLLPFDEGCSPLADALARVEPDAVVCDISPWGLAAARRLGLPSVLVENFTWDWIYAGYPKLSAYTEAFADVFDEADLHLQTRPVCRPVGGAVTVPPVSRSPRHPPAATRRSLGVPADAELVMVTMGGVEWSYGGLEALESSRRAADGRERVWLVAGGSRHQGPGPGTAERRHDVILLPHRSEHYHPDLVASSDVVVGKLGYSTLAEVAAAGARLVYVPRPDFPESPPMEAWTRRHLAAQRMEPGEMEADDWAERMVGHVDALSCRVSEGASSAPATDHELAGGAGAAARRISALLSLHHKPRTAGTH